jgi:cytochrome c biogenesis protein CcmG/thiol:disulfide interchange protein DsbE
MSGLFHRSLRAALLLALFSLHAAPHAYAQTAPSANAAPRFELKTLDGHPASLETFHGRPLLLHFFASWCDPCREEIPIVNALTADAGRQGYSVLGVAVQDTRAAVTEFARELKIAFPIALDLDGRAHRDYRIFGPPATVFIDADGVSRDTVFGPMTPERARAGLEKAGVHTTEKKK